MELGNGRSHVLRFTGGAGQSEQPAEVHWGPSVSVVIPALNEAENLEHVLPLLREPMVARLIHEVILVDGYSEDDTILRARKLYPEIRIVMQEGKGKGAALRTGLNAARGDIVVMLDADGSTNPAEIPCFVGVLLAGSDFAKGSRFLQGGGTADMTRIRWLGNRFFVVLTNLLFGTQFSDITYGYNAIWRQHAPFLALEIDGWASEIVSNIRAARHGLRVSEVASFEYMRIAGEPKLVTFPAGWIILKAIVRERFTKLQRERQPWGFGGAMKKLSDSIAGEITIRSRTSSLTRETE